MGCFLNQEPRALNLGGSRMAPTEASSGRRWIDETSSEFSSHLFATAALLCVDGGLAM